MGVVRVRTRVRVRARVRVRVRAWDSSPLHLLSLTITVAARIGN